MEGAAGRARRGAHRARLRRQPHPGLKATAVLPVKRFAAAKQRLAAGIGGDAARGRSRRRCSPTCWRRSAPRARSSARSSSATSRARWSWPAAAGAEVIADPGRGRPLRRGARRHRPRRAARRRLRRPAARRLPAARSARARPPAHRRARAATSRSSPTATAPAPTPWPWRRPPRSAPPSARAAAPATSPLARDAGVPYSVEELPSLALDLDTPADVVALTMALERDRGRAQADRQGAGDMSELRAIPVEGLPEIRPGMQLGELIAARPSLRDGDVIVISQKVVSKAEGRVRRLAEVTPSEEAQRLAAELDKDPRLGRADPRGEQRGAARRARRPDHRDPSRLRLRQRRHRHAPTCPRTDTACLLPEDPDASARRIRTEFKGGVGAGLSGQKRGVSGEAHPNPSPVSPW